MKPTLLATALAAAMALPAGAATLTFQQGMNGYSGTQDTNLRQADPSTIYGAEFETSIDASDDGGVSQALLRFDNLFGNAAGQIASGAMITSATLTLQITSAGSGVQLHDMLVPWSQATATWNSFGSGVQADGIEAAATPFLSLGANNGDPNIGDGTLVLDITDALRRQQGGQVSGHGWAMLPFTPNGTNGLDFYTSEGFPAAERPLLSVSFTPAIPEPGVWALMLAGLAVTLRMTRRLER